MSMDPSQPHMLDVNVTNSVMSSDLAETDEIHTDNLLVDQCKFSSSHNLDCAKTESIANTTLPPESSKRKPTTTKSKKAKNIKELVDSTSSVSIKLCKVNDSYTDPSTIYSVFSKLEDVEAYIMEQEMTQTTKFILSRTCKGFGVPDPDISSQKKQRVKWIASGVKFIGKPFILIGEKRFDCRHGKDKNVAKKVRYNEKRQCLIDSGEQQRINNVRKSDQLKMNCPAKIQIRDILVYTEFGVEGAVKGLHDLPSLKDPTNSDAYVKHNSQRRLRDRTSARIRSLLDEGKELKTERQFHITFPKLEAHESHEVGQAAGTHQPVDRRLISHMHRLVSQGVIHIDNMKSRLDDYVVHLFAGKALPNKDNRRYYPLTKDLSNHIQKAMASLMSSTQSTENLQQLYENLQKENPGDSLFFRPSVEGSSKLFYVHQTHDQQWLLKMNPCRVCTLEVKYRAKRSSLPMFIVLLQTSAGYQTAATFILEDEANILEAVNKLQQLNPTWYPAEWVVDHNQHRIAALQAAFPQSNIILKELQSKIIKPAKKRKVRRPATTSSPSRDLGESLREILREFIGLSYRLPSNPHSWSLVNSLQSVLTEVRSAVVGSSVTTVPLIELCSPASTSKLTHSRSLKRTSNTQQLSQNVQVLPVTEEVSSSKHPRSDSSLIPLRTGLDDIVHAVDQITRSQQGLFADQHLMTSHKFSHHLITPNVVSQHHEHNNLMGQHNLMQSSATRHLAAASTGATQGLIPMSHPSNLPLQVSSLLATDSHQLHRAANVSSSVGSVYGHLTQHQQRHYLDL